MAARTHNGYRLGFYINMLDALCGGSFYVHLYSVVRNPGRQIRFMKCMYHLLSYSFKKPIISWQNTILQKICV